MLLPMLHSTAQVADVGCLAAAAEESALCSLAGIVAY